MMYFPPIFPPQYYRKNSTKYVIPPVTKYTSNISNYEVTHSTTNCQNNPQEDPSDYFDIFGLKLYFDDILLICMIFFLYNEGVQDQMLFISLILLLLS